MKHTLRFLVVLLTLTAGFSQYASAQVAPVPAAATETPEPKEYVLTTAYPNPFNNSSKFSLTVAHRQQVRVQVFNMLGQTVRDLYSGTMEAGETKSFTFDAGDLPSGIYIYSIRGERFTAARQVTLLR
ncbi:MAG TPA: T9SS type A sorting domain-containing protein [Rhodothermales bacterium]|nr:T9SS type A sorting domain-containing protein [Rhodothermales bacterium]